MTARTQEGVYVLRRAAEYARHGSALQSHEADEADAAVAAVAELIEANVAEYAAQAAYDACTSGSARTEAWNALVPARRRRVAALARVQGGAA